MWENYKAVYLCCFLPISFYNNQETANTGINQENLKIGYLIDENKNFILGVIIELWLGFYKECSFRDEECSLETNV